VGRKGIGSEEVLGRKLVIWLWVFEGIGIQEVFGEKSLISLGGLLEDLIRVYSNGGELSWEEAVNRVGWMENGEGLG
jgi:hypothetical protein